MVSYPEILAEAKKFVTGLGDEAPFKDRGALGREASDVTLAQRLSLDKDQLKGSSAASIWRSSGTGRSASATVTAVA